MRPRTEALLALGAASALFVLAFATGSGVRADEDPDPRASSLVTGRQGVRGLADAAERLGVAVERWRERPQRYAARSARRDPRAREALVVVAPTRRVSARERAEIVRLATILPGADLVLAGTRAGAIVRCLGYEIVTSVFDSSRVAPPGAVADSAAAWTHAHLAPLAAGAMVRDQREGFDDERCPALTTGAADTLLTDRAGRPVMLRLATARQHTALLVADDALLRNRTLRASSTAPIVLDAVLAGGGRLVFDEYHHGFGAGGSMASAALAWSARSPLGWMTWQVIVVAVLALLASGVRFGPVRAAIARQRRSPLEHVRALATALAAARGHREAVAAMVRGLRRRLSPSTAAPPARDDWQAWLDTLVANAPNARVREGAERLRRLANDAQPETAVLSAANAVEDVWHSLRP